jgi:DNA-binding response OmpR family regulator
MNFDALPQLEPAGSDTEKRQSILIVDDDQSQVEALALRLTRQGFETMVAFDGARGMAMARQRRPDLVLLDLRLPDIDGFVVCEHLVDSPDTCGIPIIIVSGMERPDIVRSSRAAGCEFFVRKPYDPNALLALIQQAIRRDLHDWT